MGSNPTLSASFKNASFNNPFLKWMRALMRVIHGSAAGFLVDADDRIILFSVPATASAITIGHWGY